MNTPITIRRRSERNFGVLTDASKGLNMLFGDTTGRTVSTRTAQGFKNALSLHLMDDDDAEDIVHAGMVASFGLLRSKDEGAQLFGGILALGLFLCYHSGR